MNILHFGKFYPPFNGGMEIYLRDLAEQQAKNNQVYSLVHNHNYQTFFSKTLKENINDVNVIRQACLKPILFTPIMLGVNQQINQLISEKNIEVIHISWPNPSALLLLLNKKAKSLPWIIQWQSDMVTEKSSLLLKLAYRLFKPLEKRLLQQAQKIIVSTEEYFKSSIALSQHESKCEFVPLGIKTHNQKPNLHHQWALKQWNNAQYKIYSIGRLTFYKNHQLLIEAAQLLPEAQFIITGQGELMNALQKKINQYQLNNIKLTGSLNNEKLNALLSSCDAFCLASNDRAESYGMVLLEALQHGKYILTSNLTGSGMKWIASQTKLGYTFDPDNVNDLIKKIRKLNLNKQHQTNIPAQFTIENCAQSIQEIYQATIP